MLVLARYVVEKQGFPHHDLHAPQRLVMGHVPIEWKRSAATSVGGIAGRPAGWTSSLQSGLATKLAEVFASEHTALGDTAPNNPPHQPYRTAWHALHAITESKNQVVCGMNVNIAFYRCVHTN